MASPNREDMDDFEQAAGRPAPGIFREFWQFILFYKRWWMIPIVLALVVVAVFLVVSASPVAPFIYTLF